MPGFDTLPLRDQLHIGIDRLGFTQMTEIQAGALPLALSGKDVVGHAKTGSGKTAAFGLALLNQLDLSDRSPQALVICPTRELAEQLTSAIRALAVGMGGTRVITVTGGSPSRAQRSAIEAGAHVIIGTPGRILQHLELDRIDLRRLRCLVLDEADRMLDMGFEEQVHGIIDFAPRDRQTLLFSATWPSQMAKLSGRIQRDPTVVGVQTLVDENMLRQSVVLCDYRDRDDALCDLLASREPTATLVFCETRRQCQDVVQVLRSRGAMALALHGDLEQRDRDEVLVQLRNESTKILVATNVAARGLDMDDLGLVVCYELSPDPTVHIHRVGRTARAESHGEAISLVAGARELRRLDAIEDLLGSPIDRSTWSPSSTADLSPWHAPNLTLVVLGGRKDKLRAGDILGALTGEGGVNGSDVGKIVLTDRRVWVAVRAQVAETAARRLNSARIKKKRFRVHVVK
ncbi:MAG: ATP-independent RNA helicase DbpA [Kiritimatiellia bacterium]|jgi:ATP-independent RNA helicase DbpA